MKIYITRHGTTEWNNTRRLQGWKDSDLTQEGIENAIKLGKSLSSIDFDLIYSSPQKRALDTAELIRGEKDIRILAHNDLREMSYGIWEGMYLEDIDKNYPEEFLNYVNKPDLYTPIDEDGESYDDLFKRVRNFLEGLIKKDVKNLLLVTHGIPLKVIIALVKGLTIEEFTALPIYIGTSLNIIDVQGDKIELIVENDLSHLELI